jgi:hypothetical protein
MNAKSNQEERYIATSTGTVNEIKTDADGTFHFSLLFLLIDDFKVPPGKTPAEQAAYNNIVNIALISFQQDREVEVVSEDMKDPFPGPGVHIPIHIKVLSISIKSEEAKKAEKKAAAQSAKKPPAKK